MVQFHREQDHIPMPLSFLTIGNSAEVRWADAMVCAGRRRPLPALHQELADHEEADQGSAADRGVCPTIYVVVRGWEN